MIPVIIIIIITKNNPLQLKEKKINQLRVHKIKLNKKKLEGLKMRNANKWFDNNEESFTIIAKLSSRMTHQR